MQKPSTLGKKTVPQLVQRVPSSAGSGPVVNHPSITGVVAPSIAGPSLSVLEPVGN